MTRLKTCAFLFLVGCGKPSAPSIASAPSASGDTPTTVQAVAPIPTPATPTSGGDASPVRDAEVDRAPIYSFPRAEARYWLENEMKRAPADIDYDTTWYGFDSSAYMAFFEKSCKEFRGPTLEPKDEFDKVRSRAAVRKAREACMKRLSDDAGASPTLGRLALPVVNQRDIAWDPDNGTFDLYVRADEAVLRQNQFSDRQQFRLEDATAGNPPCGGPGILAIALPANGTFEIGRAYAPIFSLRVQDPVPAKAAKSRLTSARALRVELLVRVEGYGNTGFSCTIGTPQNFRKSEEHGYEARLLAVRLVDGKEPLTNWTNADAAAATLSH